MRRLLGLLVFLGWFAPPLIAASPELRGRVFSLDQDDDRQYLAQVVVRIEAPVRKTTETDDTGYFRFEFTESIQPGRRMRLVVEKPGWVIRYPPGGEVEVRLPSEPSSDLVDIELVPKGSRLLLAHDQLEKLIDDVARDAAPVPSEPEEREIDFTRALRKWAERYGFGLDEVRREIDRWSEEVLEHSEDAHERGLAEFAQQRFQQAETEFLASVSVVDEELAALEAEARRRAERKAELLRRRVRDLELAARSAHSDYRFEPAIRHYREALSSTSREADREDWARIRNNLGIALQEQGIRTGGESGTRLLSESVAAYRAALEVRTRDQLPRIGRTREALAARRGQSVRGEATGARGRERRTTVEKATDDGEPCPRRPDRRFDTHRRRS